MTGLWTDQRELAQRCVRWLLAEVDSGHDDFWRTLAFRAAHFCGFAGEPVTDVERGLMQAVTTCVFNACQSKQSCSLLAGSGSERALQALIEGLKDEDVDVRASAADALGKSKSGVAVSALIDALLDQVCSVRRHAARALGELGSADAIEALLRLLADPDSVVRRAAVGALGKIGSSEGLNLIASLLDDEDPSVQESTVITLGRIGSERVKGALISAFGNDNERISRQASLALFRVLGWDCDRAVAAIVDATRHSSEAVRRTATEFLGWLASSENAEIRKASDENTARSLRQSVIRNAISPLARMLVDPACRLREEAAYSLCNILLLMRLGQ